MLESGGVLGGVQVLEAWGFAAFGFSGLDARVWCKEFRIFGFWVCVDCRLGGGWDVVNGRLHELWLVIWVLG